VTRVRDPDGTDPSLASERTDLAWNRSGLALLACGAAVTRGFTIAEPTPARIAVGTIILGLGALTWTLGAWYAHRRARPGLGRSIATRRDLLPVAAGTAVVGIAAFFLGLLFPG
jgi:putative membrane protein